MKFYADSWQSQSPGLATGINNRVTVLNDLSQGLNILGTTDTIKGQGADGMKSYISEVHISLISSLMTALQTFQTATGVYWNGYQNIDNNGNFKLLSEDLNAHISEIDGGIQKMDGFQNRLNRVSNSINHLVPLGNVGSSTLSITKSELETMRRTVRDLNDRWTAYESSHQGLDEVESMISAVKSLLTELGTISVGRNYTAGSFFSLASFETLSNLYEKMSDYNTTNGELAGEAWQSMFDGYVEDVNAQLEKEAKEEAKKEGLFGLLWDTLQIATGAVITVVGLGLAPFTGGTSLGLSLFGGSLLVGGFNSAINHASMAIRGEGLNLVGMASEKVGAWYNKNIAQPARDSGQPWLEFLAGAGGAAGDMVSGMAQMNVVEISKSVGSLITSPDARNQIVAGMGEWWKQIRSGNAYVIGETAFNVVSLVVGASEVQTAFKVARGGQATSLLSKGGAFVKALGKEGAKNVKNIFTMPGRVMDNISANGKKFMQNLEDVFGNGGYRYAFAGAGDSESILNKVTRNSDVVTKNDVQKNFNKVMGESNGVGDATNSNLTAIPKKHSDFLGNDGKVPAVTKPYNEFKVKQPEWADENGYVNWEHKDAPKGKNGFLNSESKEYVPKAGEQGDRFGNSGKFSSPIVGDKSYEFPDRALPHEQSSLPYRRFEFKEDLTPENIRNSFNNASQDIKDKFNDETLKRHGQTFDEWSSDDKNLITQRGVADSGWNQSGGATQDMYPIPDDWMNDLGLIIYK